MAQKREKEETELKVPETLTSCTTPFATTPSKISGTDEHRSDPNSCGSSDVIVVSRPTSVTSPENPDLYHKPRSEAADSLDEHRSDLNSVAASHVIVDVRSRSVASQENTELYHKPRSGTLNSSDDDKMKRRQVNRCSGCRKKIGLIGFRCRCGEMFCSEHRYTDRHDCSYDYKTAGREAIARENPMARAAKILKV